MNTVSLPLLVAISTKYSIISRDLPLQAPCYLLVDHVTNPMDFASRGGTTLISIVAFHAINGMRLIDPVADLALGIRVLNSAIRSNVAHPCPYGSNSNCPAHWGLGITITVAAILDFAAVIVILHGLGVLKHISDLTKQRISEVVMLICEVSVFVCAVLVSHYDMLADSGTQESRYAPDSLILSFSQTTTCLYVLSGVRHARKGIGGLSVFLIVLPG